MMELVQNQTNLKTHPFGKLTLMWHDNFQLYENKKCKCFSPAQEHHDRIGLGWNETQKENVTTATVVTLQHGLPQRTIFMQGNLLTFGTHQMVDDMAVKEEQWCQFK